LRDVRIQLRRAGNIGLAFGGSAKPQRRGAASVDGTRIVGGGPHGGVVIVPGIPEPALPQADEAAAQAEQRFIARQPDGGIAIGASKISSPVRYMARIMHRLL
jgi:hypothetical protein